MSILKRIFGGKHPLASVRRLVAQGRWAEALAAGRCLDSRSLSSELLEELQQLLAQSGDSLAELNLSEGEACLRAGDTARAHEQFALAASHACDAALQQRAHAGLDSGAAENSNVAEAVSSAAAGCCSSGCSTEPLADDADSEGLDAESRFELVLATYPEELACRYAEKSEIFRSAFLSAHDGHDREALAAFDRVVDSEKDELYYFERGALLVRMQQRDEGRRDLEKAAVAKGPFFPALESLVMLDRAEKRFDDAEKRLQGMLDLGINPGYCHGELAALHASRGGADQALEHCEAAIAAGTAAPEIRVLFASLLEQRGDLEGAERQLAALSVSGCSGSANIALAEFWLRHNKSVSKALEAFKGACRKEPGNPYWAFRIAQAYIALGWTKEGLPMLKTVVDHPELDPHHAKEARLFLEEHLNQ